MLKKTIARISLFIIFCSQLSILNSHADTPVWKDGEFLLWSYGKAYISPADFCFALRYENEKIGSPICSYAGDWERDTTVALYAKWLSMNLDTRLKPEDLRPRNLRVIERMRSLRDRNLMYSTIRNDSVWFLLFDETTIEPKKIYVSPIKEDSSKVAKKIASSWFGSVPKARLSDEERAAKAKEPDAYYGGQPKNDFWVGLGASASRAKIPLTPSSWYKRTLASRIGEYRITRDSTSAWNFLEDSAPVYNAYIGGSLFDFIGLEFDFRRSTHKAKIDKTEEVYDELSRWEFNRYELMLSLIFMMAYTPHKHIEIKPYASAGFLYSIYAENISLKNGEPGSDYYKNRFKFEKYYSGVSLTAGLRTAFFENYAINLSAGILNRSPAKATERPIGLSTTDGFISAAVEYHIRWVY